MKLIASVAPEPKMATGGTIAICDADRAGQRIATLGVFSVQPPSGNRLFDDTDRQYVRDLVAEIITMINEGAKA